MQIDSEPKERLNRETVGRGSLSMGKNNNHKADIMRAMLTSNKTCNYRKTARNTTAQKP